MSNTTVADFVRKGVKKGYFTLRLPVSVYPPHGQLFVKNQTQVGWVQWLGFWTSSLFYENNTGVL